VEPQAAKIAQKNPNLIKNISAKGNEEINLGKKKNADRRN